MTWAGPSESSGIAGALAAESQFLEAPVAVVEPSGFSAMGAYAEAQGYLWVALAAPGPEYRGRMGLYIEESIEAELEGKGALAPGISASTGLDGSLSDQLYRARLVGFRGLALGIPSLEGITNLGRTLDAEDSGVLRWWMATTSERPVRLVLAEENMRLRVYPSPVLFETLFEVAPSPVSPRAPSVAMAESAETMALSDLPPDVTVAERFDSGDFASTAAVEEEDEDPFTDSLASRWANPASLPELDAALGLASAEPFPAVASAEPLPGAASARAVEPPAGEISLLPEESTVVDAVVTHIALTEKALTELGTVASGSTSSALDAIDEESFLRTLEEDSAKASHVEAPAPAVRGLTPLPEKTLARGAFARAEELEEEPIPELERPSERRSAEPFVAPVVAPEEDDTQQDDTRQEASEAASLEAGIAEPAVKDLRAALGALRSEPKVERRAPTVDESDPFVQLARKEWRSWVTNLDAARGPKPLSVVERMFVTDYTRLREAVRLGVADASATPILDAWRDSFSESYSEAFDALRVRGKRPTMVLDLPEMAQRLGRLQGARRVALLLVDGMRFDLGLMVQDRLKAKVDAALTERLLLWSALPTTTTYQLELLGKGPEGLKEVGEADESPALVARGRASLAPRRIRTGRLELMKLDVVEDSLREAGAPVLERLPEIADRTAEAIADFFAKQPPRTLVVVFGDHGFALDERALGTTEEVRQGGASPEEVLVPAFAWLTGATH